MRARSFMALSGLWLLACMPGSFGVWIEPPPALPPEPPLPARFEGAEPPQLEPTEFPGLAAAPSVDPTLYYYEPFERWYRHAFNRWYEAFAWDGHWFPPERVPESLKDGPLTRPP